MQQKHFALILKLNQRPDHHNYLSQIRMVNGRCRSKSSRSKMKILNTYIPTTPDSNSKYQSEKRKKVIHTKRREEQMPPISKNISEICAGHIKFNKYFKEKKVIPTRQIISKATSNSCFQNPNFQSRTNYSSSNTTWKLQREGNF
eukprot:TRINITY_DN1323_c0_g1_i6.p1 TRINITY_DN1323_c0_g1~~TRINITY_DN1323_c0_g1_i6.p1  ORF type:complete len:145 (-),score=10.30 TRINITY_DN1323_c0_g1_i6:220-654(-)